MERGYRDELDGEGHPKSGPIDRPARWLRVPPPIPLQVHSSNLRTPAIFAPRRAVLSARPSDAHPLAVQEVPEVPEDNIELNAGAVRALL